MLETWRALLPFCAETLPRACVPTMVRQVRSIRAGRAARWKLAVAHLLAPHSRVAQQLTASTAEVGRES